MKIKILWLCIALLSVLFVSSMSGAHCEIPCGIYDDAMRLDQIAEHIKTVEKSMTKIKELGKENPLNYNQLVRWVTNKETHANEIQHIVTQYFMTQRIKPNAKKYSEKLKALHHMLIYAMKSKQTTDSANTEKLKSLLKEFEILYHGHSDR
jgi:nickel superoxide dismutase